ncbi:hypothetical protein DP939_29855 [Spongiactinospora rosea]|uniref:Uncharacterized protein n=1 Tax=Spongiactinospora rosea TaxID=2248750 RepID=A0A366LRD4_9ACTN|nr:hypothetical protein [Spongiactinospora rosea]RBQ16525.1 hypothetical protein DP939_29855 [Spongiactinospora rosea]
MRVAGTGAAVLGAPAAAWLADPRLGVLVSGAGLALVVIIALAALFGSHRISERAFRLLRWITGRAEPRAPAPRKPASPPSGPAGPP